MKQSSEGRLGNLPQKLRDNRTLIRLTQAELAYRIGVNDRTVSKWETGAYLPGVKTLRRIAEVFGCSLDYLLGNYDG